VSNYGMTIPFDGVPLHAHRPLLEELAACGYTDAWTGEAEGTDGFTPLALAAAWVPGLRLGTAIVPAFTRGPALLAQTIAALAEAAPGRVAAGIGSSSNVIVERWNDIPFEDPYRRTRDVLRFLRLALTGEKVDQAFDTFTVSGFRLARPPEVVPPILVAALRPGMLHLAGREGDGAILNWLSAEDVKTVAAEVGPDKEIVARIFVCPAEDTDWARMLGRRLATAYLNVPVYAEFHRWLGRGDLLEPMWSAWAAGDRKAALDAVPDNLVDELLVHGDPKACRDHLARYAANGVTTPVIALLPAPGLDPLEAIRQLAPG
jgi:probable F420-dependent oxidoreductase